MKKSKLIDLLQNVSGDPAILLSNDLVDDWLDLDSTIHEVCLYKITFRHYVHTVELEMKVQYGDWNYKISKEEIKELKECYRSLDYEYNDWVSDKDVKAKKYRRKKVFVIRPKLRNKTSFDRLGNIHY